jgi:hypothetical protein
MDEDLIFNAFFDDDEMEFDEDWLEDEDDFLEDENDDSLIAEVLSYEAEIEEFDESDFEDFELNDWE